MRSFVVSPNRDEDRDAGVTEPVLSIVVSVVTPTYNRAGLLQETVESVLRQSYRELEYIIVDDGSSDGTSAYLDSLPPSIKVIRQSNAGQVAALTEGWRQAQGRYLAYLSDDDLLLPDALAKLASHLDRSPQSSVVFPDSDLIDFEGRVVQRNVCRPFSLSALAVDQQCFIGPGALFRQSMYIKAGGWDPSCRLLPDMEFWTRMGSLGSIDFLPEVQALYRIHSGSISVPKNRTEAMVKEYMYVIEKFFDGPYCPPSLRGKKERALANAHLMAARNYLRTANARKLGRSIAAAYRYDRTSLNIRSIARIAAGVVPLGLKQLIRRTTQPGVRNTS